MPETPLIVMLQPQVDEMIGHYKTELLRENLTQRAASLLTPEGAAGTNVELLVINWADILTRFIASLQGVLGTASGTSDQKRAAAVAAGVQFYQNAVRPILAQAVGVPFLFNLLVGPALDKLVPGIVAGIYDGINKVIPALKPTTVPAPAPGGTSTPTPAPVPKPSGFIPY